MGWLGNVYARVLCYKYVIKQMTFFNVFRDKGLVHRFVSADINWAVECRGTVV